MFRFAQSIIRQLLQNFQNKAKYSSITFIFWITIFRIIYIYAVLCNNFYIVPATVRHIWSHMVNTILLQFALFWNFCIDGFMKVFADLSSITQLFFFVVHNIRSVWQHLFTYLHSYIPSNCLQKALHFFCVEYFIVIGYHCLECVYFRPSFYNDWIVKLNVWVLYVYIQLMSCGNINLAI